MQYFLSTLITKCININKAQLLSAFPLLAVFVFLSSLLDDGELLVSGSYGPGASGKIYIFFEIDKYMYFRE